MIYQNVLAIGAFIIAGAHYVRNGPDDIFYLLWLLAAVLWVIAGKYAATHRTFD